MQMLISGLLIHVSTISSGLVNFIFYSNNVEQVTLKVGLSHLLVSTATLLVLLHHVRPWVLFKSNISYSIGPSRPIKNGHPVHV